MKIIISLILLIFIFSSCQQVPEHQFPWKPYSKKALEDSIAQHKPVVIDFYADWCPVCHELDRSVFSHLDIQSKLSQVTALRLDATDQNDPQVQRICQQYDVEGLPTVVFLDSHGQEVNNSRVIGFVTAEEFSQSLALLTIFK